MNPQKIHDDVIRWLQHPASYRELQRILFKARRSWLKHFLVFLSDLIFKLGIVVLIALFLVTSTQPDTVEESRARALLWCRENAENPEGCGLIVDQLFPRNNSGFLQVKREAVAFLKQTFLFDKENPFLGGISITLGGMQSISDFSNPSPSEVVVYSSTIAAEHNAPYGLILSICYWESGGLNQYNGVHSGELVQGKNETSVDWGMCQINDYWHPDLMEKAQSNWQGNIDAGWEVLDSCWLSTGGDTKNTLACYNGSGPEDAYANIVYSIYETRFWEGRSPWGFPLPGQPGSYIKGTSENGGKGFHEGAWDWWYPGYPTSKEFPIDVRSNLSGEVVLLDEFSGEVLVRNDQWETLDLHLDEIFVDQGDEVMWGERIGIMGNVGDSDFTHLHHSIRNLLTGLPVREVEKWFLPPQS